MGWLDLRRRDKAARFGGALALACILASPPARASPWTREEGHAQIIFSTTSLTAGTRFDRRGRPLRTGRFSKQETTISAEYGLADGLTLMGGATGRMSSQSGVDDGWLKVGGAVSAGLRARLWTDGATILSAQGKVSTGMERGILGGLRAFEAPAEAEAQLLVGHCFPVAGMTAFAALQGGYRWRGGGNADELVLDMTLGFRPLPQVLLLLQGFNAVAMQGDRRFGGGRVRRHKLQTSLVWDVSESWSIQIGAFTSPAGRDTPRERGLVAALWRRF